MTLRDVMLQIKELEEGLELSSALGTELKVLSRRVKKAYLVSPSLAQPLGDLPCFMNWPDFASEQRMGSTREDAITVQVDFYSAKDGDRGPEIALAFFDLAWEAFDAQRPAAARLGGTVDYLTLRAERPLFETLEWNGLGYPGFHIFLDLVVFDD